MTVGQLLANISSAELTEWMALYQVRAAERELADMASKGPQNVTPGPTMGAI